MKIYSLARREPFMSAGWAVLAAAALLTASVGTARAQHDHAHEPHAHAPDEHAGAHPFEWAGVYELPAGGAELVIQPGPDASIDIALVPLPDDSDAAFDAAIAEAERVFGGQAGPVRPGEELTPGPRFYQLRVDSRMEMRFPVRVAGRYALFTQHFADEFQTVFVAGGEKIFPMAVRNFRDRFGQIVIQPAAVASFGVKVAPAGLHTLVPSFTAPARVAFNAERMAHIGSAVAGRIAALPVRRGDWVKEGDTLLVVDSPELGGAQSDYVQQRTLALSAEPLVVLARSSHERARKLYDESRGVSLTEVQKRQAEQQSAESTLMSAQAAMTGAMNRLRLLGMTGAQIEELAANGTITPRYTVRAPMAGRVIRREVTPGELVGPDRDALLVLADTTTLWVLADVPEMRLRDVAIGSTARVTLGALPGEVFEGIVSLISAELSEATRTAEVRVEIDNARGVLRPGMFARAQITGGGAPGGGVLAVPDSAVQTIEGQSVVFVPLAQSPNTFLKRPVTLGEAVGGMRPVLYGLREGEPIVVAGTFILKAELGKSSAKHEH